MSKRHPAESKKPLKSDPHSSTHFIDNGFCRGKVTRHGYMVFNPNDFIGEVLDVYGESAFAEIELLGQLIKPGHVVLDIGAYIGTHTLSFARMVQPEGFVFAFEPQRLPFEFLCANIIMNNLVHVFPMRVAVSDTPGEILIPVVNPNSPANSAAFKISGYTQGDTVQKIIIDSLGLARCNLIKVDVEGMENNVIAGARNTIMKFRPVLFVENNGFGDSKNLIKQILDMNYQGWWFFSPPLEPGEPFDPEIHDKNMLCLPAEWKNNVNGLVPILDENDTGKLAYERLTSLANT